MYGQSSTKSPQSSPGCLGVPADWQAVDERLTGLYGRPEWVSSGAPLDELIATVLSQHTSDANSARAFASLRQIYPSWDKVATAPVADVTAAIHSGGLANIKASRIHSILFVVAAARGEYSLDWLSNSSLQDARSWLLALPGVGHKTAACVLLFSLGLPAMPVDTHVHRVARRLGLIAQLASAEQACAALEQMIGPDRIATYALHMNLIRHGRVTCKAIRPRCTGCALAELCPSANRD